MKHAIPVAIFGLLLTACSSTPASQESAPTVSRCGTSDYAYSVGTTEGAAGTSYTTLLLKNASDKTCTLEGTPQAQAIEGSAKKAVGPSANQTPMPDRGGKVELSPGTTVSVVYGIATASNYPQKDCQPAKADGVMINFTDQNVDAYFSLPKYEVCTALVSTFISGVLLEAGD